MPIQTDPTLLHGIATPGTGPDLSGYPRLVYSPGNPDSQWPKGVRCGSNGTAVEVLAADPDAREAIHDIRDLAADFGVSTDEVFDALRYALAHPSA